MSKNINKRKLTFLLMSLYMFEGKFEGVDSDNLLNGQSGDTIKRDQEESQEKESLLKKKDGSPKHTGSIKSFGFLTIAALIVLVVTTFTNYFGAENTSSCDMVFNPDTMTINCPGQITCDPNPFSFTTNCASSSPVCTSDNTVMTSDCPTCDTTGTLQTASCTSNFNFVCNNRVDITTNNCGATTPGICKTNGVTTNCTAGATCTTDTKKLTNNCASVNYQVNPNKNTTLCSNIGLSPNMCNVDPLATSINCPNAQIIIDSSPYACVQDGSGNCIKTDDGTCGIPVASVKTPIVNTITGECWSYTSAAKNVPLAPTHFCGPKAASDNSNWVTPNIGANPNAVTCGECFETATPFQQANNPFKECSGFQDFTPTYMQYDATKANTNLLIPIMYDSSKAGIAISAATTGACTTAANPLAGTCGGCYGSGALLSELTSGVLPICSFTPYDNNKVSILLDSSSCTTSATSPVTCGDCYGSGSGANQEQLTFNVLSKCGTSALLNPIMYDPSKSTVSLGSSTCTTSATSPSTCRDCYGVGSGVTIAQLQSGVLPICSFNPYDSTKSTTSITAGQCTTAADKAKTPANQATTCGACYGPKSGATIAERSNNVVSNCAVTTATLNSVNCSQYYNGANQAGSTSGVLPNCGITPYDLLKANVPIVPGSCTTTVTNAATTATCGACYGPATVNQQTFNVLPACGVTPYDPTLSATAIKKGTCTTSVAAAATATTCDACYGTASLTEKTKGVLLACGQSPLINSVGAKTILQNQFPLNINLATIPLYPTPTPKLLSNVACGACPTYSFFGPNNNIGNCADQSKVPQSTNCTTYDPYLNNNTLSFGDCPFNDYAKTCGECYNQPNVTQYQRDVNAINKCNWKTSGSWTNNCAWCQMHKYPNATQFWDSACTTTTVPCSSCNNALNKPECTTRQSIPCSQCGSCANGIINTTPPECLIKQSIPCTTCTDNFDNKTGNANLFSEHCAYKPFIPCTSCNACSTGATIPGECQVSPLTPCGVCGNCVSNPATAPLECQTNNTVTCSTCCGTTGIKASTPDNCKIKTTVSCSSCATCASGVNIPPECAVNSTAACTSCKSCTSGSYIPNGCGVIPSVACSSCSACTSGTNIPTECQVPKIVSCGSCPDINSTMAPECYSNVCTDINNQEAGGFAGNLVSFGVGSLVLAANLFGSKGTFSERFTTGVTSTGGIVIQSFYSLASAIFGVLILVGVNGDSGLASLSGNDLTTVSGQLIGASNIAAGLFNAAVLLLQHNFKK